MFLFKNEIPVLKKTLCLFILLLNGNLFAFNNNSNSINYKQLVIDTNQTEFSFLVAGHIYGRPSQSTFPSSGIIANINYINSSNSKFLILLGDNYRYFDSINVMNFKNSFLNKIEIPVFNAVGNHDLYFNNKQDYTRYYEFFTKTTYFKFRINSSLFIILDSELSVTNGQTDASIKGQQLTFLKNVIQNSLDINNGIRNLFISIHKEINLKNSNNFKSDIIPILNKVDSAGINIFILTGDMNESNQVYLIKENNPKITFIHTCILDNKYDNILKFKISSKGNVKISPISLSGLPTKSIDDYIYNDPNFKVSFFQKIKNKLANRSFLQGVLFSTILALFIILLSKYIKQIFIKD